MVYEAERHEALDGSDWNEATAREFIERVAAEANVTFSPRELWPTHPLEEAPVEAVSSCLIFLRSLSI